MTARDTIRAELFRAARELGAPESTEVVVERPRDPSLGAWTTNLAMTLARRLGSKPRDLAQALKERVRLEPAGVSAIEIAGPGFLNFRLDSSANARALTTILAAGDRYGHQDVGRGRQVLVEFVSANPTGPLHVGHGRQAALGDAIATLLEWTGWTVSREFYYNDAGSQIANLGLSVQAHLAHMSGRELKIADGGYHGEYIREIAERYAAEHPSDRLGRSLDDITRFAVRALRAEQDIDMQAFGVRFDKYFLESSLYSEGNVEKTVKALEKAGHTFEDAGALWLKTTDFGDDKDRVMRKSDGTYTYFVPDVAYHVTKWERGFARSINVQGADHHGTVVRVRAGLQALERGIPEGYPEYALHQMVTVMRSGAEVKISKRAGSYVTVRDLVEEVGRDAVRYFFLMRKADSHLVFDVDLARARSEDNPVYYIQMAHARMSGIFRVGEIDRDSITGANVVFSRLAEPEEQDLIAALLDFPDVVLGAAEALEPHRVANYLLETARLIHLWYHKFHVLNEAEEITQARLLLARASAIVLRNGLAVLGINAPERM
ncbi:MAG: arginine--tRNA ligase [Gemmatimonadaceae bacterium]